MTDLDLMKTLTQKADTKIVLLVMDGLRRPSSRSRRSNGTGSRKHTGISTVWPERACWGLYIRWESEYRLGVGRGTLVCSVTTL